MTLEGRQGSLVPVDQKTPSIMDLATRGKQSLKREESVIDSNMMQTLSTCRLRRLTWACATGPQSTGSTGVDRDTFEGPGIF